MKIKKIIQIQLILLLLSGKAWAAFIDVDLDPGTMGIQSSLSVAAGSSFTVNILYTGDGVSIFDTFGLNVGFNDAGSVLGLGPTGPIAGGLAGTASFVLDPLAGIITPGAPLTTGGASPFGPFAGSLGGVGMISLGLPFGGAPFPVGAIVDMFSLDFVAGPVAGSSDIGLDFFSGGFFFGGALVPVTLGIPATVTVTSAGGPTVPEPSVWLLMMVGLFSMLGSQRFRKN